LFKKDDEANQYFIPDISICSLYYLFLHAKNNNASSIHLFELMKSTGINFANNVEDGRTR
jgi:hypothetical protein